MLLSDRVCCAAAREQAGNTAYVEQMKPSSREASDGDKKQELPLQHVVSAELYDLSSVVCSVSGSNATSCVCYTQLVSVSGLTANLWCADTCQESLQPQ